MLKRVCYQMAKMLLEFKGFLLSGYYARLGLQARFLYSQSELFKLRWQEMGVDYAEQSFDDDLMGVGYHFLRKAQESPWLIKRQIVIDWLLMRPMRRYYLID